MASYSTLLHALSTLPTTIHTSFNFIWAAIMTITPAVIVSLAYRVFVMYAAARIIPAVRESGSRALTQSPSFDDSDEASRFLAGLSCFSPSILVAVYTSLLMQHFSTNGGNGSAPDWWTSQGGSGGGNLWRWFNLAFTMTVYAIELYLGRDETDSTLTSHWKSD